MNNPQDKLFHTLKDSQKLVIVDQLETNNLLQMTSKEFDALDRLI